MSKSRSGSKEMREVAVLAVIALALCALVAVLFFHYQKVKGATDAIEKKSSTKARDLLVRVCRETDGYLAFFNKTASDPSAVTPGRIDSYVTKFSKTRKTIQSSLSSLRSARDREMAKDLLQLTDAVLKHTRAMEKAARRFTGYDDLDMKHRSLEGQAQFFREEQRDAEIAGYLDQEASETHSRAAANKKALAVSVKELDGLTEDVFNRISDLQAYFTRYTIDQREAFPALQ